MQTKRSLRPIPVGMSLHECNLRLKKNKNPSCCWGDPTVPLISEGQRLTFCHRKKRFPESLQSHTCSGDVVVPNARIDARIRRKVIWLTWVTAAGNSIAFKIAAQPLLIETWLFLTAYWKSSSPYLTVPLPTPSTYRYGQRDDRETTYRT